MRKRRKAISRLKVSSDEWCDNESQLRSAATDYFKVLFALNGPPPAPYPISGCFPALDADVSGSLTRIPLDVEIKDALFSMAPHKAPGAWGFAPLCPASCCN
ncbi:hypothetical protein V6N12_018920 [Hibiscus sabdariffa]|uniref:Uncharacterized protein n=1 Tax=Hibiscus sabdariffa TaxID=183260 RepID=A0ABR1ZZE1_9ROSI